MISKDLVGHFSISGANQNNSNKHYKGILELTLGLNNRFTAIWLINNNQIQTGIGFFKDNILVINFTYQGDDKTFYHGTVVYKCISKDVLEGFWSEDYGDPDFLGSESCYRMNTNQNYLN